MVFLVVMAFFLSADQQVVLSAMPPDYIGELPPEARTPRLTEFFEDVKRYSPVPIRFTKADRSSSDSWGETSFSETETVISYGNGSGVELENLLAHELGHVWMRDAGISVEVRIVSPETGLLKLLGAEISSYAEDFVIVKIMLSKGFQPQILWEHTAQRFLRTKYNPENFDHEGTQQLTGLRLFRVVDQRRLIARNVVITSEQLEAAATALNPRIVYYEHRYFDAVGTLECTDSDTCFAKTKQLRDAVGFAGILVQNPRTGRFE
jgi:hypothetical protein